MWARAFFPLLILLATGCTVFRKEATATENVFKTLTGGGGKTPATNAVVELQTTVMREADLYVGAMAEAADAFRQRVPTTEARNLAQQWKVQQAMAAYIDATGENPVLNAVDFVVLASLSRDVVERYWVKEKFGEAAVPLLETHRRLEHSSWKIVESVLDPREIVELRDLIAEFHRQNPDLRYVAGMRLPDLAVKLGRVQEGETHSRSGGNLLSLLYLNPLAGLDPATQAIQQSRILAQRISYYVERMSMLWGWQAELTAFQLAVQPESREVLTNFNQVAQSSVSFAHVADQLPGLVNTQREAAINQIFDRLATERTNLLADLAGEQVKLRALLDEARSTLAAGGSAATSINTAIQSLDAFVRYVSPPDTNAPASTSDPNRRPFNVLDYGTAATQIGVAADHLAALLKEARDSERQARAITDAASLEARGLLNHAFRLLAVLIVFLGVVQLAVLWAYRRLGHPGAGSKER